MAFTEIIESTPQGTDKGQILDENIRTFKSAVARNFEQISGYPDSPTLVTQSWTTAGRPITGIREESFGWNTTENVWDKYGGSETGWQLLKQPMDSWTCSARPTLPITGRFGYNTELAVIERYSGSAWVRVAGGRRGDIKMWSGSASDIEAGWVLCDGGSRTHPEGGTYTPPNLMDKFIVGAGSSYAVASQGGAATVSLTADENGPHYHTSPQRALPAQQGYAWDNINGYYSTGTTGRGTTNTDASQSVYYPYTTTSGSGTAHENRPPYYALCFIYKL